MSVHPPAPPILPHPDAYHPAPLLSNPSADSQSSTDSSGSDISLGELITPRGSVSGADTVQVILPSDSHFLPPPPPPDARHLVTKKKSSRATLRPKASFSSWRSSLSASSVSLRLRPSQDSNDHQLPIIPTKGQPGQFDDAPSHSSNPPIDSRQPPSRSSSPMLLLASGSSEGSSTSDTSATSRGSAKKLISSFKRLGVTLRPTSFDRRGVLRIPSSGTPAPPVPHSLTDATEALRVSYRLMSMRRTSQGSAIAPVSFAAFLPPDRARYHERSAEADRVLRDEGCARNEHIGSADTIRGSPFDMVWASEADQGEGGELQSKADDMEERGLFSPAPPRSPVVRGIQGALSPISTYELPARDDSHISEESQPHRTSFPTPVLPSTAYPSPLAETNTSIIPSRSDILPTSTSSKRTSLAAQPSSRCFSPLEASIAREVGLSSPRPDSAMTIRSPIPQSSSTTSVRSLNRLSWSGIGNTSPSTSRTATPTGPRSGNATPTGLSCTPIYPTARYGGLSSAQSAQSLSLTPSGVSGLRRHSSLRNPDPTSRNSPTPTSSPAQTFSPAYSITRRASPIPPSLILTPKSLDPPAHPISPIIGACPIETNPIPGPEPPGRPRAKSGRWRSPTGMFELGGLGLGDLSSGSRRSSISSLRRCDMGIRYEHVDTPGEFGLGANSREDGKEQEVGSGEQGDINPYFDSS